MSDLKNENNSQLANEKMTIGQQLKDWSKELGQTSLVAATIIGTGPIASILVAGSGFGLSLLWLVALTGVWLAAATYMTGLITIATGKTAVENLDIHIFKGWGKINGWARVITNFFATAFVSVGMADALQFFFPNISNLTITIILFLITVYFVVILGKFDRIKSLISAVIMFITLLFVVNMFFVKLSMPEIINGLLPGDQNKPGANFIIPLLCNKLTGVEWGTCDVHLS